ncbi:MAG: hypothetical protein BWK78_00955 [Thiotrichaceae bacterium IS1]|nr:MAG: hypothetical protein BWK78_00955 [Thiotrichaceae bacterium IS1]
MTSSQKLFEKLAINWDEVPIEQLADYTAIEYYLTVEDELSINAPDTEKMRCYLESLHHLCETKDWERIKIILIVPISLGSPMAGESLPLCEYLIFKGLHRELLVATQEIIESLGKTGIDLSYAKLLMARSYAGMADRMAENLFEEIVSKSSPSSEIHLVATAHLGIFQTDLGSYQKGIPNLQKSLAMINQLLDSHVQLDSIFRIQELKTEVLESLALYEMNRSHFQKAMTLYEEVITLRKQHGLFHKLIDPLVHQGVLFRRMKNYEQAIQSLEEARKMATELDNNLSVIWCEHHLAYVLLNQGKEIARAEALAKSSLKGYEELERPRGTSDGYEQLGLIYLSKDDFVRAEQYFQKALDIRKSIRNLHGTAASVLDLALVSWHKRQYFRAIGLLFQGFKLYFQLGILNPTRVVRMLKLAYTWIFGKKDWTM